jgi:hypothetical protein
MSSLDRNIGIDFGTSTSVLCYLDHRNGRPDSHEPHFVKWGEGKTHLLPSLIYEVPGRKPLFGRNAKDASRKEQGRGGLVRDFKMDLLVADRRELAVKRMSVFFSYMREQYEAQRVLRIGTSVNEHTFVSFPAKWPAPLRQLTVQAARDAGFVNVQGIDEPTAAMQFFLTYETSEIKALRSSRVIVAGKPLVALLIDMGAGTTDLVLFRTTPGEAKGHEVLRTWPQAGGPNFGGRDIDARLRAYIVDYLKGILAHSDNIEEEVADYAYQIIAHKEEDVSPYLLDDRVVEYCSVIKDFQRNNKYRKDAKPYFVDRRTFGNSLNGDLRTFVDLVNGLLDDARTHGMIEGHGDVDVVLLTGGHSKWYFVPEMLRGQWVPGLPGRPVDGSGIHLPKIMADPRRVVTNPDPQAIVAQGLTLTGLNGIDIVKRAANNLWYVVAVGDSQTNVPVLTHGEMLPYDTTLHQRIPLRRDVAATTLHASVVPVSGPTVERGDRYANHPIKCDISTFHVLDQKTRDIASAARDRVADKVYKGLEGVSVKLGYMSEGIERVGAQFKASDGKLKAASPWIGSLGALIRQLMGLLNLGAKRIKDETEKIAREKTDIKEDQVDLILKVNVDMNERVRYIGALDLVSAAQWWMFWYNQDEEPTEADEQAMWEEIKDRRKSR